MDLLSFLESIHDLVEQHWGRVAAWIVSLVLLVSFVAAVIWVLRFAWR